MAEQKVGYFRENWRMLVGLLFPLVLLLTGIVLLILYQTSYTFRIGWDAWWENLFNPAPPPAKTASVAPTATYPEQYFTACKNMPDNYVLPSPHADNPISLRPAIGLKPYANEQAVKDRCIAFAQTVQKMTSLSQHNNYAYLCPGTRFVLGNGFSFVPAPGGNAVLMTSDVPTIKSTRIPLSRGDQTIYKIWQFYNPGGGCYVIGYSTAARALEVVGK